MEATSPRGPQRGFPPSSHPGTRFCAHLPAGGCSPVTSLPKPGLGQELSAEWFYTTAKLSFLLSRCCENRKEINISKYYTQAPFCGKCLANSLSKEEKLITEGVTKCKLNLSSRSLNLVLFHWENSPESRSSPLFWRKPFRFEVVLPLHRNLDFPGSAAPRPGTSVPSASSPAPLPLPRLPQPVHTLPHPFPQPPGSVLHTPFLLSSFFSCRPVLVHSPSLSAVRHLTRLLSAPQHGG